DKDGAVRAGVEALLGAIGASDAAPAPAARERPTMPVSQIVLFAILGVGLLILFITNPSLAMYFLWAILSGGRGGGFGGGGSSDGGGGGCSGGGGRSGGGGARGSW